MSDPLVEAIDAARKQRPSNLHNILGWMILHRCPLPYDVVDEIRSEAYVGIAKLLNKNALSIDIARQIPTIIRRRLADHFGAQEAADDGRKVVSLEALDGYEPADTLDIAATVEEHAVPTLAQQVFVAMRDSRDETDRRGYLILEAELRGGLDTERIQEIMGKDVSDTYMSTLLHRAKQRFVRMYESAGGRRIGA